MKFTQYLKSKQNLLIVLVLINLVALFVNIFQIEGDISPKDIITDKYEKYAGVYLFSNSYVEHKSDKPSSHFWPFVKFYKSKTLYNPYNNSKSVFSTFNGIFYKYDISEFIAYVFTIFLLLYIRWKSKYNDLGSGSNSNYIQTKKSSAQPLWYNLIERKKNNGTITNGLTIPYLVGAYSEITKSGSKDALIDLISDICNTNMNHKAVLQYCGDINQYVISLKPLEFCIEYFDQTTAIKNQQNVASLYISPSATNFGFSKSDLIDNLWLKYEDPIINNKYSWKSLSQSWESFSDIEKEEIHLILKS